MSALAEELGTRGVARLGAVLSPAQCDELIALYREEERFRSRIVMARYGFGSGEYKYFGYPLPDLVHRLRTEMYWLLAPIANAWAAALGKASFPTTLAEMTERCHAAGQVRPTPLLLKYGLGDFNCLHQDLYGEHVFPLQLAIVLSEAGRDFDGGEMVFVEQRPRQQSRPEVVSPKRGEGVVFAVNERPVQGSRGSYRVKLRHGVSRITRGERFTLGVIFHDAP